MANNRYAQKQAYDMVPETCPKVDSALSRAMDAAAEEIKQQTSALRDALVSAIERAEDAEDEVKQRDAEIDSLNQRIFDLERELAEALAEAST